MKKTEQIDLKTAIFEALDGNAILFTGSGFSFGAKNILGDDFPVGDKLKKLIAKKCNQDNTKSRLDSVAQYYQLMFGSDSFIKLLKDVFTFNSMPQLEVGKKIEDYMADQKKVLSLPWKRIYTVNYDIVAETLVTEFGSQIDTVVLSKPFEKAASSYKCIHLNGCITNLNDSTLYKEFKLTSGSYYSESLRDNPWFNFMEEDFKSAKAIFFVGYSNECDLDVSRILALPEISSKLIFINDKFEDAIAKANLEKLGLVYEFKIEGLASRIEESKKHYTPSPITKKNYDSFLYEYRVPDASEKPTLSNLTDFYYKGIFSDSIFKRNRAGEYEYIVGRSARKFFSRGDNAKVYLAISTLGNGKTVFCRMFRQEMRTNAEVFTLIDEKIDVENEIADICKNHKRAWVVIDDYYHHMNVLKLFEKYGCENICFLLTTRQTKLATNYRRLLTTLNIKDKAQIRSLYLTRLDSSEIKNFQEVLSRNNMLNSKFSIIEQEDIIKYFTDVCKSRISNIVLDLFDSSLVKKGLSSLLENILKDEGRKYLDVCILGLASSVMNLKLSFSQMLSLLNYEVPNIIELEDSMLADIFNIDTEENSIELSSSIISRKMLHEMIKLSDLISVLYQVVIEADKRKLANPKYAELIKAILSHTNFEPFFKLADNIKIIKKFYDDLRRLDFCTKNPFYWEQFAIICQDAESFTEARQCLKNAYSEAKLIKGFVPFQISTIDADLCLDETIYELNNGKKSADMAIESIRKAHDLFFEYYEHPENDHNHIFTCVKKYLKIFDAIKNQMTARHLSIYIEKIIEVTRQLEGFLKGPESVPYGEMGQILQDFYKSLEIAKDMLKKRNNK